uniref:Murine leukemia virus integrase C-terminal domain-containing protein n=1 Tax=Cairina moschata TaxID=8855 RepID=A0A8C3C387_CAIMO
KQELYPYEYHNIQLALQQGRGWNEPLKEKWKGPYTVLLHTHIAIKAEGIKSWIHYNHIKAEEKGDTPPEGAPKKSWQAEPTEDLKLHVAVSKTQQC